MISSFAGRPGVQRSCNRDDSDPRIRNRRGARGRQWGRKRNIPIHFQENSHDPTSSFQNVRESLMRIGLEQACVAG
jgi:hypothetical protein